VRVVSFEVSLVGEYCVKKWLSVSMYVRGAKDGYAPCISIVMRHAFITSSSTSNEAFAVSAFDIDTDLVYTLKMLCVEGVRGEG
jgi:hypothetical protein